ncbi:unnamed protein product [Staurois parvus]|uniref:Uncharacterized protein n=1 Tax=Staurois parvus TaxID=386267 RepID=A0ABN9GCR5_9NEOB|nr:unnamed protein product [Staurois parvus]
MGGGGWCRIVVLRAPRECAQSKMVGAIQGRTDNSWGPQAIGDHGAPVSLPKLKKSL